MFQHRQLLVIVVLAVSQLAAHADQVSRFGAGLDGAWNLEQHKDRCVLSQAIPDFGEARFERRAGRPLSLKLAGERTLFEAGELTIHSVSPPWAGQHEGEGAAEAIREVLNVASTPELDVPDPMATDALMALYAGSDLLASGASWFAPNRRVEVQVASINVRPVYEQFVACFEALLPASWQDIERSALNFATNKAALPSDARKRLDLIVRYLQADPTVGKVYIDGHTDDEGSRIANVRLSQRRASVVADQLAAMGIDRDRLVVRFHGDRYPIADNASEAGKASNRRTTVRLEKSPNAVAIR
ncbi:MAG: OmpA family protein [Pseudomonadaceae bacterium]|nr:OmpA family protein [Pseudomonadaceae bacterium]